MTNTNVEMIKKIAKGLLADGIPFEFNGEVIVADGFAMYGNDYQMPFDKDGKHATGYEVYNGFYWTPLYEGEEV